MVEKCSVCGKGEICECGVCHICELGMAHSNIPDFSRLGGVAPIEPRTQKVKGYVALSRAGLSVPGYRLLQTLDEDGRKRAETFFKGGKKVFARGAPKDARHGFVDSTLVTDADDAIRYLERVLAVDAEGEVLLTEWQPAMFNVLWTPGRVAIGPNHDGATAGRGAVTVPLVPASREVLGELPAKAGIPEGNDPYVEAVLVPRKGDTALRTMYTQIRNGPRLDPGVDFVPRETKVREIVTIDDTYQMTRDAMLAWETRARELARKEGVVVWHPGGTRSSHWAVHCFLNGVPCMISKRPRVGETLAPTSGGAAIDVESVARGVAAGTVSRLALVDDEVDPHTYEAAVMAVATGLHNVSAFEGDAGFFLGVAAAAMIRLGAAAAIGETRHEMGEQAKRAKLQASGGKPLERRQIYRQAVEQPLKARRKMPAALRLFLYGSWPSHGFGGPKWGACVEAWAGLEDAVRRFMAAPSEEGVRELGEALNVAVNQAHNGGWWLNKFGATKELFDKAITGDPRVVVPAAPIFYWAREVEARQVEAARENWRKARPLSVAKAGKPRTEKERERLLKIAAVSDFDGDDEDDEPFAPPIAKKAKPAPKASGALVSIHAKIASKGPGAPVLHVQYKREDNGGKPYLTKDVEVMAKLAELEAALAVCAKESSWAGSDTQYAILDVTEVSEGVYSLDSLPGTPDVKLW